MAHVFGQTDPFAFPPSEFNFGVLQAVEPFLVVHRDPRALSALGAADKFKGGQMKGETLDECLQVITQSMAEFERPYKDLRTELNFRLESIRQVEKFTDPTDTEYKARFPENLDDDDDEDQEGFIIKVADEDLAGAMVQVPRTKESPPSSDDEQAGYHLDTEAPPQAQYDVPEKGRTDARAFVFSEGPRRRATDLERPYLSAQRCAAVFEFKADEELEAITQAACYARAEVRRNMCNRHYKPVQLLVLSKQKFTYGVLKCEGQIVTGGNKISDTAYEDFKSSTKVGSTPTSKDVLDIMLARGNMFLRQNYVNKPNPRLPKRPYIVGNLYVAPEWYSLPSSKLNNGFFSPDAKKFYEGMLRMAVGDKVLKYTTCDVMAALGNRMAMTDKQSEIAGGDFTKAQRVLQGANFFRMAAHAGLKVKVVTEDGEENVDTIKRRRLI